MKMKYMLSKGHTNKTCGRYDPILIGKMQSIHFISQLLPPLDNVEEEQGEMAKIYITNYVRKSFKIFKKGDAKAMVQLIRYHKSIVANKKLWESYHSASSLINAKKTSSCTNLYGAIN